MLLCTLLRIRACFDVLTINAIILKIYFPYVANGGIHGYFYIPASSVEMIAVYSINFTYYLLPAYTVFYMGPKLENYVVLSKCIRSQITPVKVKKVPKKGTYGMGVLPNRVNKTAQS